MANDDTEEVTISLTLTREEWCEMANALTSKASAVSQGEYGPTDDGCDIEDWVATLHRTYNNVTAKLREKGVEY